MLPAYTMPPDAQEVTVLRALVKSNVPGDIAEALSGDIIQACATLDSKGGLHANDRARQVGRRLLGQRWPTRGGITLGGHRFRVLGDCCGLLVDLVVAVADDVEVLRAGGASIGAIITPLIMRMMLTN